MVGGIYASSLVVASIVGADGMVVVRGGSAAEETGVDTVGSGM